MHYDVAVIGGGLAGSSAAIHLAGAGHRVLLLEKQPYPAHKLCGEFLSVEVTDAFARLGVLGAVRSAGARTITDAFVTTSGGADFRALLPGTALGLSRYRLDALLFERARSCGADARDGTRVRSIEGTLAEGFRVRTDGATFGARVVLGAYGKRDTLDRRLGRAFLEGRSPFVGFKAHYEGLDLPGVVELHAFPGGYCGLLPVEGDRVNACWIAHERALKAAGGRPEQMVEQVFRHNGVLADRFGRMRRVSPNLLAVSQVRFSRKATFAGDVCMIGDTAATIAPLCGDGMAMALRSSELAAPLVHALLIGTLAAPAFRRHYTAAWHTEFDDRMRLGRWIHHLLTYPRLAGLGVRACRAVPALAHWVIARTRGDARTEGGRHRLVNSATWSIDKGR